jgi:hypothetical protein
VDRSKILSRDDVVVCRERNRCKKQLRIDEARKLVDLCITEANAGDDAAVGVLTALLLGVRASEITDRVVRCSAVARPSAVTGAIASGCITGSRVLRRGQGTAGLRPQPAWASRHARHGSGRNLARRCRGARAQLACGHARALHRWRDRSAYQKAQKASFAHSPRGQVRVEAGAIGETRTPRALARYARERTRAGQGVSTARSAVPRRSRGPSARAKRVRSGRLELPRCYPLAPESRRTVTISAFYALSHYPR